MRTIGAVIFPGFEMLDLYGPLELFGSDHLREQLTIRTVGPNVDSASAQGPRTIADDLTTDDPSYDILLVPGGAGTREIENDEAFMAWLKRAVEKAEIVAVVCTGTILVAKTGLLDGHKATTNKKLFKLVSERRENVDWIPKARWVESGKFFTASGVSAGMDMSLALIAKLFGKESAEEAATSAEYDWHQNADWDPFAAVYGLVEDADK